MKRKDNAAIRLNRVELNTFECTASLPFVQDALYVIGGKWKIPIIVAMLEGGKRFGEIKQSINKISAKVLTHELKELEINGFIIRNVLETTPIIEYELTDHSYSLGPVIKALSDWGYFHRQEIRSQILEKHREQSRSLSDF